MEIQSFFAGVIITYIIWYSYYLYQFNEYHKSLKELQEESQKLMLEQAQFHRDMAKAMREKGIIE